MIRWGILGAGGIAATVGADIAASPDSTVVAVGARDRSRAAALAARLGAPRAYGSYADLVADPDVDVIYVATTHAQHHEHALLALRAGKPVLVEKAFTLNAREAREVVAEATDRGLFCMEAMWMRFHPMIRAAQDLIAAGAIGPVRSVRAELSRHFPYDPSHRLYDLSAGGGGLLDLGVYPATFAWLFLGQPDVLHAVGGLAPTGSDSAAAMLFGYDHGGFAQVSCTTELRTDVPAVVAGRSGWIEFEGAPHHPTGLRVHGENPQVLQADPVIGNGYGHQVAEVERCLAAGLLQSPRAPLDETVAILALLDETRAQIGVRYPADGES